MNELFNFSSVLIFLIISIGITYVNLYTLFKSINCHENKKFENLCAKQVLYLVLTTAY